MSDAFRTGALLAVLLCLIFSKPGKCQHEAVFRKTAGKFLANYVIQAKEASSESECGIYCSRNKRCASVNYKTSGINKGLCELNSKSLGGMTLDELTDSPEYIHLHVIKPVS